MAPMLVQCDLADKPCRPAGSTRGDSPDVRYCAVTRTSYVVSYRTGGSVR